MVRVSPSSPAVRPGVTPDGAAPDTGALPTVSPAPADDPRGLALGFTAYFVWGLLPLYMAVLAPAGALEIVVVRLLVVPALLTVLGPRAAWPSSRFGARRRMHGPAGR